MASYESGTEGKMTIYRTCPAKTWPWERKSIFERKWALRQAQDEAGSREGNATKQGLGADLCLNSIRNRSSAVFLIGRHIARCS